MSTMDDFNRALFDRAKSKYNRAQFEQITTDEWCALVEGFRADLQDAEARAENAESDLRDVQEELEARDTAAGD